MTQRVMQFVRLVQTERGFQFLPPAPAPGAAPAADPEWQARGADAALFHRPALRVRAEKEIPAGRAANFAALATLKARVAAARRFPAPSATE